MVRVLSCHHFQGQHIGQCEEAVSVAVAGCIVIVGLDHQVNVYAPSELTGDISSYFKLIQSDGSKEAENSKGLNSSSPGTAAAGASTKQNVTSPTIMSVSSSAASSCSDIGTPFTLQNKASYSFVQDQLTSKPPTNADSKLKLSHSFQTVDLLESLTYNQKGHYLLSLEKREVGAGSNTTILRVYFQWDRAPNGKTMRARIAGLVSPTGSEPEHDTLTMVEIPRTSSVTAAASCQITGYVACLSAESIVHVFVFRMKESTGRIKVQYADFDRLYSMELASFVPDNVACLSNYVVCWNPKQLNVFHMYKEDRTTIPIRKRHESANMSDKSADVCYDSAPVSRVVYDPSDESTKIYLPTVTRSNRRRHPILSGVTEDYMEDIMSNKTKVVFTAILPGISIEDVLRISVDSVPPGGAKGELIQQVNMSPILLKDMFGGISCVVAFSKEAFVYHFPNKRDDIVVRVISYPFTAPLITCACDSLFFHALTESGLETYTCRSLYYPLKETEGFKSLKNDCPLRDNPPCLVGIRPFLGVRRMACSEQCLCLLASPTSFSPSSTSTATQPTAEENLWTVYSLKLPDIGMIYQDTLKAAQLYKDSNPDTFVTLISELHILLRLYMGSHPNSIPGLSSKYFETCKLLGFEYIKSASAIPPSGTIKKEPAIAVCNRSIVTPSDLIKKGVTYLLMSQISLESLFSDNANAHLITDPKLIPGIVKFVELVLPTMNNTDGCPCGISPKLAPVLMDFLASNGPHVLVDLVINIPFLRECNTQRLSQILKQLAMKNHYSRKETLAYLLALVTMNGTDDTAREEVKNVLLHTNSYALESVLKVNHLVESKQKATCLTDLAVCLAGTESVLTSAVITSALKSCELHVGDVMMAFAQALNMNSDSVLQQRLAKNLTQIIENYFVSKLDTLKDLHCYKAIQLPIMDIDSHFNREENAAVVALVQSYLSHISLTLCVPNPNDTCKRVTKGNTADSKCHDNQKGQVKTAANCTEKSPSHQQSNLQIFGNVPTFTHFILTSEFDNTLSDANHGQSLITFGRFSSEDCKENYIKLTSLLSSCLRRVDRVQNLVTSFLQKSNARNSPLYAVLQLLTDSPENSISLLISKQPTTLLLFGKEMFGRTTANWRVMVALLKQRIQAKTSDVDADIYSTIIESVYLHLANTLSPPELEDVLDKGSDNAKYRNACKRVDLAGKYANMVMSISQEYLSHKE